VRSVTRREGIRLAYAAPAVAASLAASRRGASAAISGECPPGRCFVEVVVTDAATGEPLGDAVVDLPWLEADAGPDGTVSGCSAFGGFQVEAAGYAGQFGSDRDFCAQSVWTFALVSL